MKKLLIVLTILVGALALGYFVVYQSDDKNTEKKDTNSLPRAGMLERSALFSSPLITPEQLEEYKRELDKESQSFTVITDLASEIDWDEEKVVTIEFFAAPGESVTGFSTDEKMIQIEITSAPEGCAFVQTQNKHIVFVPLAIDFDLNDQDRVGLSYIENQQSCND